MCLGFSPWQGYECASALPSAGKPGMGLTALGKMQWPAAPSKRAPNTALHQGWPCRCGTRYLLSW